MEPPNDKSGMAVVALILFGFGAAVMSAIWGIVLLLTNH